MSESNKSSALSKFNFFAILILSAVIYVYGSLIEHQLNVASMDEGNTVDFSKNGIQSINEDFFLVSATQKEHLTGVVFKGRIINASALKHTNVSFHITADYVTKEFTINQISSGNSTSFSVYIPEISLSNARYAEIEYLKSSMYYKIK